MTESGKKEIVLPIDVEHGGIRLVGCVSFIIVGVMFFAMGNIIFSDSGLVVAIASVILAAGAAYLVDMFLKGRWLSGRELVLGEEHLALQHGERLEKHITRASAYEVLMWRFKVTRGGRVKKGWHVVACALEQDGVYLPIYSFCSPESMEAIQDNERFVVLERQRKDEKERDMRLAGEQRRLHDAEAVRGLEGAELLYDDFVVYLDFLKREKWLV